METYVLLPPEDLDPERSVDEIEKLIERYPDIPMTMIIDDPPTRVVAVIALVEEGVELREAGVKVPVLVMGGYYGDAYGELVHHELTVVLQDPGQLETLALAVKRHGQKPFQAHLKLDTGMALGSSSREKSSKTMPARSKSKASKAAARGCGSSFHPSTRS